MPCASCGICSYSVRNAALTELGMGCGQDTFLGATKGLLIGSGVTQPLAGLWSDHTMAREMRVPSPQVAQACSELCFQ